MKRLSRPGHLTIASLVLAIILAPSVWAQSNAPTQPQTAPSSGQQTAAGFANVLYVPAKVGTCILGGVSWFLALALSGGTAYNTATQVVRGSCGGEWVVRGKDIEPNVSHDPYSGK
jgi:hypothetical protein